MKRLEIVDTSALLQHEEIVPKNLKRLKEAMFNIGMMVDPIIMAKGSNVVLDGNHRLMVLKDMDCPHAVIQPVDYESDEITIGTWLPASASMKIEDFKKGGIEIEKVGYDEGMEAVQSLKAAFMFGHTDGEGKEAHLISPGSYSFDELIVEQKKALGAAKINGNGDVMYIADDLGEDYVKGGKVVLFRRSFTKGEVVEMAKRGTPFPPKSTRHIIPNRIIRLNMKLGWLFENKDDTLKLMDGMLSNRVYQGNVRRYPEPVIVIY